MVAMAVMPFLLHGSDVAKANRMFGRRKPLLIPVRDRRQSRRILTLRNFRNVMIAAVIIYGAATLIARWSGSRDDEYGRLLGTQLHGNAQTAAVVPVTEAAVSSSNSSSDRATAVQEDTPSLTANTLEDGTPAAPARVVPLPGRRANVLSASPKPAAPAPAPAPLSAQDGSRDRSRFVIVNDGNGVHVERSTT
jgi:hypothetical protein